MKNVKSQIQADADKKKKEFKDMMYDYIYENMSKFIDDNYELIMKSKSKNKDYQDEEEDDDYVPLKMNISFTDHFVIRAMIVQYLIDNDKMGSIRKVFVDGYLKEYLVKKHKKNCFYILEYFC